MGQLQPSLEESLLEAIERDKNLRREFENRQELIEVLGLIYKRRLKKKFQQFERAERFTPLSHVQTPAKPRDYRSKVLMVAALAAIIIALIFIVRTVRPGESTDRAKDLFAQYFSPPELSAYEIFRAGDQGEASKKITLVDSLIFEANQNLDENNHHGAILALRRLQEIDSNEIIHDQSNYLLGLSHLMEGNYDLAIKYFERVDSRSFQFGTNAEWYRAFSLLAQGAETSLIIKSFEEIPRQRISIKQERVRQTIIDKLKSISHD